MNTIQKNLFEIMPLAYSLHKIIFNAHGLAVDYKLVEFNPAFDKCFGAARTNLVGKRISKWLFRAEKIPNNWQKAFAELGQTGAGKEFENILEFNGHWYLVTAFRPNPNHLILFFHQTSRFQKAQAKFENLKSDLTTTLKTSQAFSHSIFNNNPSSIVVYEVKADGASANDYIIRSVNPTSLKLEGWQEKDVIGKPLGAIRPGADEFGIIPIFRSVWKTGRPEHYPARAYREGQEERWFENTVFKLPSGEIVAIYNDVTESKLAEKALFAEKERLKVTLYSIGDGVITTDTSGKVEMLNPIAEKLTGWKHKEAQGLPLTEIFNIYDELTGEAEQNPVKKVLETKTIVGLSNHTMLKAKDGTTRAISDSAAPIRDPQGKILGVVLVFRDVTEKKKREARIEYLSYRDTLTGLYNRTFFEEQFKQLDEVEQYPLTLILGDLDGLKLINDAFGHQLGDQALIKTAEIIRNCCQNAAVIARWGGDEFSILLPQTDEQAAQQICDRIKTRVATVKVAKTELRISLGCATKTEVKEERQEILARAENNMYKAKLLGAKSYRSVVLSSIKKTLFEKSYETDEHGQRLGYYCKKIGERMGLTALQLAELEVFSMLHDIGKIGIPEQILQKPGKLTKEEWKVIKTHPEIGYRIAQTVPELVNIAGLIFAHHERWDGNGYPKGLAEEKIPLLARILAVADAYDAMTNDRSYRRALSPSEAKEELWKNAGTQFDPQIVSIFLSYLQQEEHDFS